MPDDNGTPDDNAENAPPQPEQDSGGEDNSDSGFSALPAWAQDEIRSLRNEAAKRRTQNKELAERMTQLEADRQKRLTEQERLQEMEAELQSLRQYEALAKTRAERIAASNTQRIAAIPEHMRSLIPDGTPEDVAAYLDKNTHLLTKPVAPNLDAGAGGNGRAQPELSEKDKAAAALAQRHGFKIDLKKMAERQNKK
ncbi:MAG: hypothetical protein AAF787_00200 [Chloroflexota bacterium]